MCRKSAFADFLVTFGGPGTAKPRLQNHNGSDFNGIRFFGMELVEPYRWEFWTNNYTLVDVVPVIASHNPLSWFWAQLEHPKQKSIGIGYGEIWDETSPDDNALFPFSTGAFVHPILCAMHLHSMDTIKRFLDSHGATHPEEVAQAQQAWWASKLAYHSAAEARPRFHHQGLKLLATVEYSVGWFLDYFGYTHLVLDAAGDCTLAFKGTEYPREWIVFNAFFTQRMWCGIDGVHAGFAAALRQIISTSSFQNNLKPKLLSQCRKLTVTGHSLGGAMAELFAACCNNPPQFGTSGWDDYALCCS